MTQPARQRPRIRWWWAPFVLLAGARLWIEKGPIVFGLALAGTAVLMMYLYRREVRRLAAGEQDGSPQAGSQQAGSQ